MRKSVLVAAPILAAVLLLSAGTVNALVYSNVQISANVTQVYTQLSLSSVRYVTTFYNLPDSSFNVSFPRGVQNLKLLSGASNMTILPVAYCHSDPPTQPCMLVRVYGISDGVPIVFTYDFNETYTGGSDLFNTSLNFLPSTFTQVLNITMLLPSTAYLPSNPYYSLNPSSFTSSSGRFSVTWLFANQTAPFLLNNQLTYIDLPFTIEYAGSFRPQPGSAPLSYTEIITAVAVVTVLVGLWLWLMFRRRIVPKKVSRRKKNNSLFSRLLTENEKKVLSAISRNGFTQQSEVISSTGFSKVKVSKIVSKLYKYRLIKIKSNGRQNMLKRS